MANAKGAPSMVDTPRELPENLDSFSLSRRELLVGAGGGGAPAPQKRGGNFRLAVTGGGAKDIMDGQTIITKPDQARLMTAFETLLTFDENYQLQNDGLATQVTQDNPKQYTIELRQGVEFSNGKTMT